MMPDDFEKRLRAAVRRETGRLPFVVKMADVERALAEPSRRFPRWIALAAIPLGTALVAAILLATPRPPPVATSTPSPASCGVSPVTEHGSYREIGGPRAFFEVGDYYADASWKILVRWDPAPASDARLSMWATTPAGGDATVDAGQVDTPQPASSVGGLADLPGAASLAIQPLPSAGCWTLHAAIDGREVGRATINVATEPISACDAARRSISGGELDAEQGGPHVFFRLPDQVQVSTTGKVPPIKLLVRQYPASDRLTLDIRAENQMLNASPVLSVDATLTRMDAIDFASPPSLPGTYFSGALGLSRPGCWRIDALNEDGKVLGSAVMRVVVTPASCPVTRRPDPAFVPPTAWPATPPGGPGATFWYGTDDLWTAVNNDGSWGAPNDTGGYFDKSFWWSAAFNVYEEPEPSLQVTARRLDRAAEAARSDGATNAGASDIGSAMLTGLTLPTGGCWELTGRYRGHELSYVIWIPAADPTSAATPAAAPRAVPAPPNCPVTARPDPPFVPPTGFPETPRPRYAGMFWYGSEDLWTLVNESGAWNQLPNGGDTSVAARDSSGPYQDKSFWWSTAFNVSEDSTPALRVTGRRLDGPAPAAHSSGATNAIADLGPSMLTGLTVPTSGCWELTGHYRDHELSYVVWIPGPDD
jgi:hypothetical protein